MSKVNNTCPAHYKHSIEPWDYIIQNNLGYLEGNVIKYITRWRSKGGLDDLSKARHYIDKIIEVELSNGQGTEKVRSKDPEYLEETTERIVSSTRDTLP